LPTELTRRALVGRGHYIRNTRPPENAGSPPATRADQPSAWRIAPTIAATANLGLTLTSIAPRHSWIASIARSTDAGGEWAPRRADSSDLSGCTGAGSCAPSPAMRASR